MLLIIIIFLIFKSTIEYLRLLKAILSVSNYGIYMFTDAFHFRTHDVFIVFLRIFSDSIFEFMKNVNTCKHILA